MAAFNFKQIVWPPFYSGTRLFDKKKSRLLKAVLHNRWIGVTMRYSMRLWFF